MVILLLCTTTNNSNTKKTKKTIMKNGIVYNIINCTNDDLVMIKLAGQLLQPVVHLWYNLNTAYWLNKFSDIRIYRVFIKRCVFFFKNYRKFDNSPSPALDCYKLYRKLHSHCVESFEGGVVVNCEKNTFFSEHPVQYIHKYGRMDWQSNM